VEFQKYLDGQGTLLTNAIVRIGKID